MAQPLPTEPSGGWHFSWRSLDVVPVPVRLFVNSQLHGCDSNTELLYLYDVQIVPSINQQTGYFSKKQQQQQQQKLCHSSLGFSLTIHIFYVAVGGFL